MPFLDSEISTVGNDDSISGLLVEFGNFLQTKLSESLFSKGSVDTAALAQSIIFEVDFAGGIWSMELSMEEYGEYIDEGVQGVGGERKTTTPYGQKGSLFQNKAPESRFKFKIEKKPSARHFEGWARRKGLSPFAVREKVFREGIKPNNFISEVITDELIDEFIVKMEEKGVEAIGDDILNFNNEE